MTPAANVDANGQTLFIGDEVVLRAIVKDVRDGHVLTNCIHAPVREFWFTATAVERTAQGAASRSADTVIPISPAVPASPAAAENAAAPAAPVNVAVNPNSPREQAIAHVMSHDYDRVAAEKIVEEQGTSTILADRDAEAGSKKEADGAKSA